MRPYALILFVMVLAACGGSDDAQNENRDSEATPTPTPAAASPVRAALQQDYEALRASQQAISDIWEALAANREVQCGSYPDTLNPEGIFAEGDAAYAPLAESLRRAAIDLDHAVSMWRAECANPRRFPPPDVIDEGRRAARSAGDALREAETLLEEN